LSEKELQFRAIDSILLISMGELIMTRNDLKYLNHLMQFEMQQDPGRTVEKVMCVKDDVGDVER
jgi:hypothetical protein